MIEPARAESSTKAELIAVIQQRYQALQAIWTARSHTHEQQRVLMAEIKGYAERVRAIEQQEEH